MKNLYYELTSDGYYIYDKDDSLFIIHQYEPYIPDHSKSYEENAIAQMEELQQMFEPEPDEIDALLTELESEVGIND